MQGGDDKTEEDLAVIQKTIAAAAGKVAHHTKAEREKITQSTPENVKLREEAAARCTKKIRRRMHKTQARKARAEHQVKCVESHCQNCTSTGISQRTGKSGKESCRGTVKKCTLTRRRREKYKKTGLKTSKKGDQQFTMEERDAEITVDLVL